MTLSMGFEAADGPIKQGKSVEINFLVHGLNIEWISHY